MPPSNTRERKASVATSKKINRRLYDMVKANNYNRVKELIAEGADPNAKVGKKGMTAMHRVAMSGNHKLEAILSDGGGNKIGVEALSDESDGALAGEFKPGDKVVLSADYNDELDALYGPLDPGETGKVISVNHAEEAAVLVKTDAGGEEYRYTEKALVRVEALQKQKRLSQKVAEEATVVLQNKQVKTIVKQKSMKALKKANGVLAQIAQMEKMNQETQQQKNTQAVVQSMSRLAVGTKQSFRKNVKVASAFQMIAKISETNEAEQARLEVQKYFADEEKAKSQKAALQREEEKQDVVAPMPTSIPRANQNTDVPVVRSQSISTSVQQKPKVSFEFPRENLSMGAKLGEGNFGIVFAGEARGLVPGEGVTSVAVKTLNETQDDMDCLKTDFLTEVDIMKTLTGSDKVVRLLGIITQGQPFCMLMEIMGLGDLKKVLRDNRPKKTKESRFSWQNMAEMGSDIAEGMSYLASKKIVHRDLAARNCLVNASYTCKIGDFGLTRSVYSQEYYRMTGSSPLPIRWMAPESLDDGVSTGMSDVWSFGVVIWEVATFAKLPYGLLSNMEVCEKVVEEEFRMPQPKGCPDQLYDVMSDCWKEEQNARPQFSVLFDKLKVLAKELPSGPITMLKKGPASEPTPQTQPITSSVSGETVASSVTSTSPGDKKRGTYIDTETVIAMDSDNDDGNDGGPDHYVGIELPTSPSASSVPDEVTLTSNPSYIRRDVDTQVESMYYDKSEKNEEDAPIYSDTNNAHLSDFEMAVANAQDQQNIKTVTLDKTIKAPMLARKAGSEAIIIPRGPPPAADENEEFAFQTFPTADENENKNKEFAFPTFPTAQSNATMRRKAQTAITSEINSQLASQMKNSALTMRREEADVQTELREQPIGSPMGGRRRVMSTSPAEKEAEASTWISNTTGVKILPGTLADVLNDGFVLLTLLTKLKAGSVSAKFKKEKHAVRKRQNIAWFLESLPVFGVQDRDRFETNDLFEKNDMKQVLMCLLALKLRVE